LSEKFEYLKSEYGVKTVFNSEFADKNNLASLHCVTRQLNGTYLLVADNWLKENIFHRWEFESWLYCEHSPVATEEWVVNTDHLGEIKSIDIGGDQGWFLAGPAYLAPDFAKGLSYLVDEYYQKPGSENYYWEDVVRRELGNLPPLYQRHEQQRCVYEFESLAELRAADPSYLFDTDDTCLKTISRVFGVPQYAITGFQPIKTGMTNRSFVFRVGDGLEYVYRSPGVGTEELIDRRSEKQAYDLAASLGIMDDVVYFDTKNGTKISRYYEGSQVLDPENPVEVKRAMELLRDIHAVGVPENGLHFDVAERLDYYTRLLELADKPALEELAPFLEQARKLLSIRDHLNAAETLCHIDYIFANILTLPGGELKVIDWEYSGLADPLVDVAMFSIYTYYNREQIDQTLSYYLGREPLAAERLRVYLYVALAGLLWHIWCCFKAANGETFGEYPEKMLKYFTDYFAIITTEGQFREFITSIEP